MNTKERLENLRNTEQRVRRLERWIQTLKDCDHDLDSAAKNLRKLDVAAAPSTPIAGDPCPDSSIIIRLVNAARHVIDEYDEQYVNTTPQSDDFGYCDWRTLGGFQKATHETKCGHQYPENFQFKFCPNCGKEINFGVML